MSGLHERSRPWRREVRRALRAGLCGTSLGVLALIAWAALAPLAAAVIAEGTVKSAGNRKTVQHAEGGIVAAIHVKDGDRVMQGQPLVTLADERVAAGAQSLQEQWMASTLKAQRLGAETRGVPFVPELGAFEHAVDETRGKPLSASLAQRERELFAARARQQAEQSRWLSEHQRPHRLVIRRPLHSGGGNFPCVRCACSHTWSRLSRSSGQLASARKRARSVSVALPPTMRRAASTACRNLSAKFGGSGSRWRESSISTLKGS